MEANKPECNAAIFEHSLRDEIASESNYNRYSL
jgi:hypothetical protein